MEKVEALTKTGARYDMHQIILTMNGYKEESREVKQAATQAAKEEKKKRKAEESEDCDLRGMKPAV